MAITNQHMTPRQREIKDRLDEGMGAREIASELGISRNAVYQQIQRMRKYGVLDVGFTPTGQPVREIRSQPASDSNDALVDLIGDQIRRALAELSEAEDRLRSDLQRVSRRLQSLTALAGNPDFRASVGASPEATAAVLNNVLEGLDPHEPRSD